MQSPDQQVSLVSLMEAGERPDIGRELVPPLRRESADGFCLEHGNIMDC